MNRAFGKYRSLRLEVSPSKSGERIKEEYKLTFNDDGTKELVVVGKVDVYEMIQSHKDSVDVHMIIERCATTGDLSELYKRKGFFADLADFPTNYAEVLKNTAEAEYLWKKLPSEIKEKFNNDVSQFYATAFSKEWYEKLAINESIKPEMVEDNKESVVNE